jgi:hypothetical protein
VAALNQALRRPLPLLPLLALLAVPAVLHAHRLDEYLQATLVAIEPGHVRLQVNLQPGVAIAEQILRFIDLDRDGAISSAEADAYVGLLRRDLTLRIDGKNVPIRRAHAAFPVPDELRTGTGVIRLEFSARFKVLPNGMHRLDFANRHLAGDSVYLFNAVLPDSKSIRIGRQQRNQNQSIGQIDFTVQSRNRAVARHGKDS